LDFLSFGRVALPSEGRGLQDLDRKGTQLGTEVNITNLLMRRL